MAPTRERKLNFKQLLLLPLTLHFVRVRCAALMFILCHAAKNEPRKRAKGCRLWKPLPCRATWRAGEKNMDAFYTSLAAQPPRAAGGECKNSCFLVGDDVLGPPVFENRFCYHRVRCRRRNILLSPVACVFRVGVFLENTDAKSEDATLRANMSGVITQRRLHVAGF